ncbi:MAG: DUF4143 domain-containing protein [Deltaproteobacteria bacterium]|nr:MAG: DUF4143 domain-containing protein [Deltaproteobacteria bacterium]
MKSVRKRLTVHPKFYFFDTGVTNAINHRLSAQLDSVIKGRLFEQWLILETHRMISYKNSEARMFYWRTNNDVEVDLLIEKHGKIRGAFEFKSSHNISGRDAAGLRSFSGERENKAVPLYIVGDIEDSYSMDSVNVISWKLYLENVLPEILK